MRIWSKHTVPAYRLAERRRALRVGAGAVGLLMVCSGLAAAGGLWKLLGIAWVAFAAMAGTALVGSRRRGRQAAHRLVWGYGVASGTMIAAAAVFLLPEAMAERAALGGFGVAGGVLVGFGLHTLGHQLTHTRLSLDPTTTELTTHALADGLVLGLVYTALPELNLLLGLAIVSHKAPAGYAVAQRLRGQGRTASVLLLPAAAVGLAALPVGLLGLPPSAQAAALVSGFATGVFLHMAMDFLPSCELGSEVYEAAHHSAHDHHLLDRLRWHAVASTACGGLLVFVAWLLLA